MSEAMSSGDFFEQLRQFSDEAGPELIAHWREVIKGGGKRTFRYNCAACGQPGTLEAPVADSKELLDIANALRLARAEMSKQSKDDTAGTRARQVLRNLEEMTSEELAERIAELEVELAES